MYSRSSRWMSFVVLLLFRAESVVSVDEQTNNKDCSLCPRHDEVLRSPSTAISLSVLVERGYGNVLASVDAKNRTTITCGELDDLFWQGGGNDSGVCDGHELSDVCPCKDISRDVIPDMDAPTQSQKVWLSWIPRLSALLSLTGSTVILWDVWRGTTTTSSTTRAPRTGTLYHWLVSAISVCDISGSLAWLASTLPIPEETGIYGAKGNEATCKLQGFTIQLGITGTFVFVSLSIYYLLTIRYNVRESHINRWKLYFLVPPISIGVVVAFVGLPFYRPVPALCHLPPRSFGESESDPDEHLIVYLVIIPITLAFCTSMVGMVLTYLHVRKTDRTATRWRANRQSFRATSDSSIRISSEGDTSSLSMIVFWKFALFVAGFLLTWPILVLAILQWFPLRYTFYCFLLTLQPLQGMWNALAYFWPTLARSYLQWKKRKTTREARKESSLAVDASAQDQAPSPLSPHSSSRTDNVETAVCQPKETVTKTTQVLD